VNESLEFTGERFTPECVREIWYEHWHRYAWARGFARGRRVLDAACGEGYGSALLADVAASVLGVDISDTAVTHARARYAGRPNLRYEQADATALDALADGSFDLIVSFETLEHVEAQEALVAGFARLLAPGGLLLLSSPDRQTYSDARGYRNEHHVRELYRGELEALLGRHFGAVRLYAHKLLFQSAIWPLDAAPTTIEALTGHAGTTRVEPTLAYAPLYFLALCARADEELPAEAGVRVSLFGDAEESVYRHYDHEVRKNMGAGLRIQELERELAAARAAAIAAPPASVPGPAGFWQRLRRRLGA
jgi:SAM-dependent methyltransferase